MYQYKVDKKLAQNIQGHNPCTELHAKFHLQVVYCFVVSKQSCVEIQHYQSLTHLITSFDDADPA